ncbi:MAG: sigma-54 dependent transcriptional regulator [Candidatus Hydrothermales bacterium]
MKVLIVEDDEIQGKTLEEILREKGFKVRFTSDPLSALYLFRKGYRTVLLDLKMPQMNGIELMKKMKEEGEGKFLIITAHGSIESAVNALKEGAFDYFTKPLDIEKLLNTLKQLEEREKLEFEVEYLKEELKKIKFEDFIVVSEKMKKIFYDAEKVARTDATVLITGESGVGKEVLARYIHTKSGRKGNFVTISCTAIPSELLEAELFGYEKGAFTGANKSKKGKFELADEGTLFLDEIGDMPLNLQSKILRFLQDKTVERLGSLESFEINTRIICATNKDLEKLVREGKFREDLYYRINVISFNVPPLRERREEILSLFDFYLEKFSRKYNLKKPILSERVKKKLLLYSFPGNVRELINLAERVVLLRHGEVIEAIPEIEKEEECEPLTLEEFEKRHIEKVLKVARGKLTKAAEILGIHRNTLREKLKKYGIKFEEN